YSGSVALKADLAFRIWNHLAPEGMFHLFSPQEVMMLNLMHPIGLTQKQRLVWMEWLVGAYRSFVIRENVENPVPYFKRAVSLKERGSEEESSEGVVHRTEWHVPQ
ncbi:MAG: hypothetical protein LBJ96_00510, partial [Holosporaceae bacterium]|nr:hypothetical protein [Holosporaceae bacterium]